MDRASEQVLYGFRLRVDGEREVIRHPGRYQDKRGVSFFASLVARLKAREKGWGSHTPSS
jgi:hypothetical protein